MRLMYPVVALVGALVISACSHHDGTHSASGQGLAAKNYGLTYEQVREAAQDGDADAQYALGYMYYYGQNVARNGKQARFWIGKAAAQNHQQASRALKMMGADSHAASSESGSDSAQVSAGRGLNSAQNSWQEVRRPQASSAQAQANQPQAQNEAGPTAASAIQANTGSASAPGYSGSSPQALPQKPAFQLTQAKNSAQDVAVNADAQRRVRDSGQGKLADADVPAASKKHRRAELHKKNRGGSLASSQTSDPAKGQSKSAAVRETDATSRSSDSASATENTEATADAEPSLVSAQQKLTQPRQKVALRQGKFNKAQSAESHGAKAKATTLVAKGKGSLTSDERRILSAPGQHYTLQLMGSGSKATLQKLIASQHLQQKARIYHTTVKGKDFYGLIYGSYPSQAAAQAAIAHLPASVQQLKPWAKPYASVKASINLAASQPAGKHRG